MIVSEQDNKTLESVVNLLPEEMILLQENDAKEKFRTQLKRIQSNLESVREEISRSIIENIGNCRESIDSVLTAVGELNAKIGAR